MQVYERSARETLHLPGQAAGPMSAPWAVFDPDWYRLTYPDAPEGSAEELLEWHLAVGQTIGHSPNRYFDEQWQRRNWPGIAALIEAGSVVSAFDAWCRGPHKTRPPHWLFDPIGYRTRYPALTDEVLATAGFINDYHHFLGFGAAEHRIGHDLFDPKVYLGELDPTTAETAASMPFRHYLQGLEGGAPERRASLLFDPDWYAEHYPEASRSVGGGPHRCLLEHYLCNDRPIEFDPSPWFSERHYLGENPGVAKAIGPEGFRNGFAHFLAHGLVEGRSPHPDLDLAWYANLDEVRNAIASGLASDPFVHWFAIGRAAGLSGHRPAAIDVTAAQAAALHERRANIICPLFARHKLDFTCLGVPAVSVIMTIRDHFAESTISLASLRTQFRGAIELILIGSSRALAAADVETHVTGAAILTFGAVMNDSASREAGLVCATAEAILLLGDGIELAPGAIDTALTRLLGDPTIGAVGGRLVLPHGELKEAGGIIWRNGELHAYARDALPSAAEANFVRDVDFCSTLFLLARREVLSSLSGQAPGTAGTTHDAADLCLRIHQAGFRVVYEPDALAFLTIHPSDGSPNGQPAFVAAYPDYLAGQREFDPAAITRARSPDHGRPRVLLVEDTIPLRRIGSGFVRSNDVLRAMVASGASVTVFPMNENRFALSAVRAELPDAVEVMHDLTSADFASFIARRRGCYDLVWIARTHNLELIHQALAALGSAAVRGGGGLTRAGSGVMADAGDIDLSELDLADFDMADFPTHEINVTSGQEFSQFATGPDVVVHDAAIVRRDGLIGVLDELLTAENKARPRIVIDTEAVSAVREAGQAALLNETFDLDAALRREFRHLEPTMDVVAVSEAEAGIIRAHHRGNISVVGHKISARPTPRPFEKRAGMLFVGAIHATDHPNHDGLTWFIDEVLPLIERVLRWETRLTVAGYIGPGVTLDRFKGHPRVTLRGPVADLRPLYDANRVFVAPARFAAGVPYKVHEAAGFGIPVVATTLLARQLGWADGGAIGAAEFTDAPGFAARVISLYRDENLWTKMRAAALARVTVELAPELFASRVEALLRPREPGATAPLIFDADLSASGVV